MQMHSKVEEDKAGTGVSSYYHSNGNSTRWTRPLCSTEYMQVQLVYSCTPSVSRICGSIDFLLSTTVSEAKGTYKWNLFWYLYCFREASWHLVGRTASHHISLLCGILPSSATNYGFIGYSPSQRAVTKCWLNSISIIGTELTLWGRYEVQYMLSRLPCISVHDVEDAPPGPDRRVDHR